MIAHSWHQYWAWTGGNIGALPMEWLVTGIAALLAALVLRPLLRRAWARLKRELGAASAVEAKAARRIAADLFEHHTGRPHPDAPDSGNEVP